VYLKESKKFILRILRCLEATDRRGQGPSRGVEPWKKKKREEEKKKKENKNKKREEKKKREMKKKR
jgi:hypothetical protein